jgi:hypothetical protein
MYQTTAIQPRPLLDRIAVRSAEPDTFVPVWRRRLNVIEADRFLARQDTTDSIYSNGTFTPRGAGQAVSA